MDRQQTMPLGDVIKKLVKVLGLEGELERYDIFNAWDEVVGLTVAKHTSNKFYRDGILYCTLTSSVVRSKVYPSLELIRNRMNEKLSAEKVQKIILK